MLNLLYRKTGFWQFYKLENNIPRILKHRFRRDESTWRLGSNFPVSVYSGVYVAIIMTMSAISTLTAILVLYMHHHDTGYRPPLIVRRVAFGFLARIVCMRGKIAQYDEQVNRKDGTVSVAVEENRKSLPGSQKHMGVVEAIDEKAIGNGAVTGGKQELLAVLRELRSINAATKDKEKGEAVLREWRALAIVIDRSLFWMTSLSVFVATLVCFVR